MRRWLEWIGTVVPLLAILAVTLLGMLLGSSMAPSVAAVPSPASVIYTYDGHHPPAVLMHTTTQRGPQAAYDDHANVYDHPALLAQVAKAERASETSWWGAATVLASETRSHVAAKGADEGISGGRYLFNNWYKSTFPNRTQSVNYHVAQHGNGRSAVKYTQDAMDFFAQNRSMGVPVTLRDGTAGIKIATKQPLPGGGVQKVGGYWTSDGRLVTYWD